MSESLCCLMQSTFKPHSLYFSSVDICIVVCSRLCCLSHVCQTFSFFYPCMFKGVGTCGVVGELYLDIQVQYKLEKSGSTLHSMRNKTRV